MSLTVCGHPLARHYLSMLRDRETDPTQFRTITARLTTLLLFEATRDIETEPHTVRTPLEETDDAELVAKAIVAVPILRAGLGMLSATVELLPNITVGYLGFRRDEVTSKADFYYHNLPDLKDKTVLILEPMLATGGTASQAIEALYERGATDVRMMHVVAAPEGVRKVQSRFPEVRLFVAAVDRELNARNYIVPGLGDFGDRLYGTE